jgi:hypothetical protein
MKKILQSISLLFLANVASSQVLLSEDFNGMTVGNVGTVITGATAGQGDWFTANSTGGTNANNNNYQVVSQAGNNVLQITGSDAATGTRFMWKDGLVDTWAARTIGNDIIEVEFDYNPSVASTSLNGFRVYLYSDEATPKVLAGIGCATNTTVSGVPFANVVQGFAYWVSTPGTGTYAFGLGPSATVPIVLNANETVRLGFSFNTVTGEVRWKGPGVDIAWMGTATNPVVTVGIQPGEVDFLVTAGTGNVVADSSFFDNLVVRASATDTLLAVAENSLVNTFSVYPNPANDIVTISSNEVKMNVIEMTDINGRVVKNVNLNGVNESQLNISDLAQGVYMLKINSENGVSTKKVIKE